MENVKHLLQKLQNLRNFIRPFRASELGRCNREIILSHLGIEIMEMPSPALQYGRLFHSYISNILINSGAKVEVPFFNEELNLEGTIDGILDDVFLEFKTTSNPDNYIDKRSNLHIALIYQLGAYSILSGLNKAIVGIADIHGVYSLVSHLDQNEKKIIRVPWQEIPIEWHFLEIEITPIMQQRVKEKIFMLRYCLDNKILPPPSEYGNCKYCQFSVICNNIHSFIQKIDEMWKIE